jgi:hypothetical protein
MGSVNAFADQSEPRRYIIDYLGDMIKNLSKRFIFFFFLSCGSKFGLSFFLFTLLSAKFVVAQPQISSNGNIVINEVLANEPGSYTKLEWVELYNADSIEHNLGGWAFVCKEETTLIPAGTIISGRGFLVLARKLLTAPPDSVSFEGWWGNRSGIWGDSQEENFPAIEAEMSLTNTGGTVSLVDPHKNVQTFTWDKDCGDGVSWERVSPEGDIWFCCIASEKSTPGSKNSVSTSYSDKLELTIEPNPFSPDGDGFEDEVTFRYSLPMISKLTLRIYDVKGRLIKTLMEEKPQVSGEIIWNGKDDKNRTVRVGIYIVWAEANGNLHATKKITLVVAKR